MQPSRVPAVAAPSANPAVVEAAFSDSVLLEGNNSDVIELSDTRALVLRVNQFNEATIPPLEEVEPEIAVLLRTQMEREAVQEIGDQLMVAASSGAELEPLLEEYQLQWIDQQAVSRTSATANRDIINEAFSLPRPQGPDDNQLSSLTLPNGTFVLIELTAVTPGSLDSMSEEEITNMRLSMSEDLGSNDFTGYLSTWRENADIQTSIGSDDF